jgi:hypothetical protein
MPWLGGMDKINIEDKGKTKTPAPLCYALPFFSFPYDPYLFSR